VVYAGRHAQPLAATTEHGHVLTQATNKAWAAHDSTWCSADALPLCRRSGYRQTPRHITTVDHMQLKQPQYNMAYITTVPL
jgi:hypothetical protein